MVTFLFLQKDDEFKDIRPCIYYINLTLISLFLGALFILSPYKTLYIFVGMVLIAIFYAAIVGNFILLLMRLIIKSEEKYLNKIEKTIKNPQIEEPRFFNFLEEKEEPEPIQVDTEETTTEPPKEIIAKPVKEDPIVPPVPKPVKTKSTPKKAQPKNKKTPVKQSQPKKSPSKKQQSKPNNNLPKKTNNTKKANSPKKDTPKKTNTPEKKAAPKQSNSPKKKVAPKQKSNTPKKKNNNQKRKNQSKKKGH